MDNILYYYTLYLKSKKNKDMVEIHLIPFKTKEEAKDYKSRADEFFGNQVVFSKIRKTNLKNCPDGRWL